jgi:hypothetical protein
MPVWPKSFHTFGINLMTASTEWKLRQARGAGRRQRTVLRGLLTKLAKTSHWSAAGLEAGMDYADFRSGVPVSTHSILLPQIERMRRGEADVLWPGRCDLFALTTGTGGARKLIPVTDALLQHFRRAGLDSLLYYTVRVRHAGAFRGRHLLCGSPTTLVRLDRPELAPEHPGFAGDISGVTALTLPEWAERHLYEPGAAAAKVPDWESRLDAIAARTERQDITLIAALPTWGLSLANLLRDRWSKPSRRIRNLQGHWPNLECFVHSGMALAPYAEELRDVFGQGVTLHEVYAATECMIAAQDTATGRSLRVMADAGIFFEFIPLAEYDEKRLPELGTKAVPLAGVSTGIDYVMLVTTPGGLVRYALGDVVRFTSTEPPRLTHVGRTDLRLNSFGENVSERDVTQALVTVCEQRSWRIVNFHVAAQASVRTPGRGPTGRHEWWIELRPGTLVTPTGTGMAGLLDAELRRMSETYDQRRGAAVLDPLVVRLVMPGIFQHWMRFAKKLGGQHKIPRCTTDRTIAQELASITNFAED